MSTVDPSLPEPSATAYAKPLSDVNVGVGGLIGGAGKILLASALTVTLWAVFVPMDSAVVAHGPVSSSGQNKLIQHRTGGIIKAIHYRDGDFIEAGAVLFELDPVSDEAQLSRLQARRIVLQAISARLEAQKRSSATVSGGDSVLSPAVAAEMSEFETKVLLEQEREFLKSRQLIGSELEALRQKGERLQEQRNGLTRRLPHLTQQIENLQAQFAAASRLEKNGHISRQQVWEIESRLLDRQSERLNIESERDGIESAILENQSLIENAGLRADRLTSEQLTNAMSELQQISGEIKAAENERMQTRLRAPIAGTLIRSTVVTVGGVVRPAETLAEIVPQGVPLEVDARVRAQDIKFVHVGQPATVRISGLNPRLFDPIEGRVNYVAADSTQDERTGERHFKVKIDIAAPIDPATTAPVAVLGMMTEAFLKGEKRTFFHYLAQPLIESAQRAFSEAG